MSTEVRQELKVIPLRSTLLSMGRKGKSHYAKNPPFACRVRGFFDNLTTHVLLVLSLDSLSSQKGTIKIYLSVSSWSIGRNRNLSSITKSYSITSSKIALAKSSHLFSSISLSE